MISVNVRQQGGAVIMTIPANLVKMLDIEVGDRLALDVVKGKLVASPVSQAAPKRYTLEELLQGVSKKAMTQLNAETAWAREGAAVGRELA